MKRFIKTSLLLGAIALIGGCANQTPTLTVESKNKRNSETEPRIQHMVFFSFDSDALPQDADAILTPHADYLIAKPSETVRIVGYADDIGNKEFNYKLGLQRAEAVRNALIKMGVAERQLSTSSFGERVPLNHEKTHQSLARNRRAALYY